MATISNLIGRLKLRARISPEEKLSSSATPSVTLDDFLAGIVQDAITQHNPNYTAETLPISEEMLVLILAQIEVAYVRAEKFVNDAAIEAGGNAFKIAPDSPFNKNLKLATTLYDRYMQMVDSLGVSAGTVEVVAQSTVYKRSDRLDALFPYFNAPPAPAALVTVGEGETPEDVVVDWSATPKVDYFKKYWLFWALTPGIYQDYNASGNMTVPRIKTSATLVYYSEDQDAQAVELTDLLPDTDYYFMVVTQTGTNKYTYSNEVLFHTAA